jgi:hypothetical protein
VIGVLTARPVSQPERHHRGLHGAVGHRQQLSGQGRQVDLLAEPVAEGGDGAGGVVAPAVEEAVDQGLDAPTTTPTTVTPLATTSVTAIGTASRKTTGAAAATLAHQRQRDEGSEPVGLSSSTKPRQAMPATVKAGLY